MLVDHNPTTWFAMWVGKYAVGYVGVGCFIYFLVAVWTAGVPGISHPFSITIEVYGAIEILWYLIWFLPFKARLQKPGLQITPMSRAERKAMIALLLDTVPDVRLFVRGWFSWAHLDDIYRDDIKDWMLWALWGCDSDDDEHVDEEEMEEYIQDAEERANITFLRGRSNLAKPMRLNVDKVKMLHRSLLFYVMVGMIDNAATLFLLLNGFTFWSQPLSSFFKVFPFRPMTLLTPHRSAAPGFSYFHRRHKSKTHRPIVLCHGIGIGMPTYIPWMLSLPKDIGIIAIEFLPVSGRICPQTVTKKQYSEAMRQILSQHEFDDFVYVGHSYGTMMARPLLDDPVISPKIHALVLCDPVAILLHLPDVAFNITRRIPKSAPQLQIQWGAALDPMTAHTLCRRFVWQEHILFRHHLVGKRTTAVVAGRDCVINAKAVASYVQYGDVNYTAKDVREWGKTPEQWTGEAEMELMYLGGRDHGQSLLIPTEFKRITKVVEKYCRLDFGTDARDAKMEEGGSSEHEAKTGALAGRWEDGNIV